jgi:hypothetical protein
VCYLSRVCSRGVVVNQVVYHNSLADVLVAFLAHLYQNKIHLYNLRVQFQSQKRQQTVADKSKASCMHVLSFVNMAMLAKHKATNLPCRPKQPPPAFRHHPKKKKGLSPTRGFRRVTWRFQAPISEVSNPRPQD